MLKSVSDLWKTPANVVVAFIKFTTAGSIQCPAGCQKLTAILLPVRGKDGRI